MKLQSIKNDNSFNNFEKLFSGVIPSNTLGRVPSYASVHLEDNIAEQFISSSYIVLEQEGLLGAGLSALQSLAMPGVPKDVPMLTRFLTGKDTSANIKSLLDQSKRDDFDINDGQWWNGLFNSFGITNKQAQNNIKQSAVGQSVERPAAAQPATTVQPAAAAAQPAAAQPTAEPSEPASQPATTTKTATQPASAYGMMGTRQPATEPELASNKPKKSVTTKAASKKATKKKAPKKTTKKKNIAKGAPTQQGRDYGGLDDPRIYNDDNLDDEKSESYERIAEKLLQEKVVKENIHKITSHMLRSMGISCIIEANVKDTLLNRLRRFISQPSDRKDTIKKFTDRNKSQNAAKIAINKAADFLRDKFNKAMSSSNLDPQEGFKALSALYARRNNKDDKYYKLQRKAAPYIRALGFNIQSEKTIKSSRLTPKQVNAIRNSGPYVSKLATLIYIKDYASRQKRSMAIRKAFPNKSIKELNTDIKTLHSKLQKLK